MASYPTIGELGRVALTQDVPEAGLKANDVGTVVHVYRERAAYEVEFVSFSGDSLGVSTIEADGIRKLGEDELPSTRSLSDGA